MTFEETIGALLEAKLAPLRGELVRLSGQIEAMRRTLPPPVVTVQEAARLRRVHVSTVRRWLKDGTLKAVRTGTGKKCLVDLSSVQNGAELAADILDAI
jgi:excisionase family DNA binding protein